MATFTNEKYIDITRSRKLQLKYFAFVAFFLPAIATSGYSTIFNLIIYNPIGYRFLPILLSLPLICRPRLYNSNAKIVYQAVFLATIYQVIVFIATASQIGVFDTFINYRYSFCQCLHFALLIPFITRCEKNEIDYIIYLFENIIICFSIIYLLDCLVFKYLSNVALGGILVENRGGISVNRSIIGFPPIYGGWIFLFFLGSLQRNRRSTLIFVLCLFAIVISFTRSLLLEAAIGIFVVLFSLILFKQGQFIGRSIKSFFAVSILLFIFNIFNPNALSFWENKLSETFRKELKEKEGTYSFRQNLIEDAKTAIEGNEFTGLGYIRDSDKGEYSMVQGTDTFIAPTIYCEGYVGLTLRVLPYFLLLMISLRRIFHTRDVDIIDFTILALVLSSIVGYVQTITIMCYPLTLMVIMIFKQKQYYSEIEAL